MHLPYPGRYAACLCDGMAESIQNLYISNMTTTPSAIHNYSLFGESDHLPDVLHCETIAERSALHDWELAPHRHARLHQVLLIQSGEGNVNLDDNVYPLHSDVLVNVPPGHVHAFRFTQGTCGWVTTLAVELLDEIFVRVGDIRRDLNRPCVGQSTEPIRFIMQQIWQEFSGESKARALVLRGLSTTLLGWVARAMNDIDPANPFLRESSLIQRFKQLVELHFLSHWRVSDYAQALSISPTHLNRLARVATGVSASGVIEARTMREARRHLAYTNLSVTTIAYTLGYTDPAYFSRVFTKDAKLSPRAFRSKVAGGDDAAQP